MLYKRCYDGCHDLSVLVGATILRIEAIRDEYIRFITDRGEFAYACEGDCCSSSWIEEIYNIDALLVATVAEVEELPTVQGEPTKQEVDRIYGIKITTNKGVAKLVHRNSSNGYYGGSLDRITPTDDPYGFELDGWTDIQNSAIKTQ